MGGLEIGSSSRENLFVAFGDAREQFVALGTVAGIAGAVSGVGRMFVFRGARKSGLARRINNRPGFGEVTFADGKAIEGANGAALIKRLWPRAKVIADVLPGIPALVIGPERSAGIIAAVDHAVLTARVARDAIDNAVLIPGYFLQHFLITGVMAV